MVETDAVLEVSNGIFDLGVATMVGLQFQGVAVPVGDEGVIAVGSESGQLRAGRGPHPPDDEPHRRGTGLTLEWGSIGLSRVGSAVHPIEDRHPVRLRYGLDEIPQPGVLADRDGESDTQLASGRHDSVGVETAFGPHRELSCSPGAAHPSHRLTQEVGGTPSGVGVALPESGHQHVAGAGGDGQQGVIASLAGVAVVAGPSLASP